MGVKEGEVGEEGRVVGEDDLIGGRLLLLAAASSSFQAGPGLDNVVLTSRDAVGGVPEPATWGLMIMGFGGIGAMLRRRQGAPAIA